jgi:hypothetical protein
MENVIALLASVVDFFFQSLVEIPLPPPNRRRDS